MYKSRPLNEYPLCEIVLYIHVEVEPHYFVSVVSIVLRLFAFERQGIGQNVDNSSSGGETKDDGVLRFSPPLRLELCMCGTSDCEPEF